MPDLARRALEFLTAFRHLALATLRRDGSPRISATEIDLVDGELWIGCLWHSRKALDLRRDPRFALHSGSPDPPAWAGDAKLAGRVEEVTDPDVVAAINGRDAPASHLFRADVAQLVVVEPGKPADHLVIDTWCQGRGVCRHERR